MMLEALTFWEQLFSVIAESITDLYVKSGAISLFK